ncbi:hypothetical protein, partial [Capnocytophaga bilenii]
MIIFFAYTLGCASFGASRTSFYLSSHTRLRQLGASRTSFYPSSHTRLRQLVDFPSLILRLSFAHPSLIL